MVASLAFVRHAALVTTPLFLLNTLPDRMLIELQVEGFTKADAASLLNRLLDSA